MPVLRPLSFNTCMVTAPYFCYNCDLFVAMLIAVQLLFYLSAFYHSFHPRFPLFTFLSDQRTLVSSAKTLFTLNHRTFSSADHLSELTNPGQTASGRCRHDDRLTWRHCVAIYRSVIFYRSAWFICLLSCNVLVIYFRDCIYLALVKVHCSSVHVF